LDKRKPTYRLSEIKDLIRQGACVVTGSATKTAYSIGFSDTGVKDTVLELEHGNFYKSTTENANQAAWQDVYKILKNNMNLYIKLKITVLNRRALLILSFKGDESKERNQYHV
jgi:hypothetical protein